MAPKGKHQQHQSQVYIEQTDENEEENLPPYTFHGTGRHESVFGRVRDDGRVDIDLDSSLSRAFSKLMPRARDDRPATPPPNYYEQRPQNVLLNIVLQVVGSRGDVQPFIALGNELQRHGHRVRLATHSIFEGLVKESNIEFYPIGGDPEELMAFMVKNPGLIPSMEALLGGEIQKKRRMILKILRGCWDSCIKPDLVSKVPFVADAIIANPPNFAHVHCAQALGIPLHLMFTMPWSSTKEFPHPLANIKHSKINQAMANYLSYGIVGWMTWQGLGDIINGWRYSLDLENIPISEAPLLTETLKIPFTYCWSPAFVPKPSDWHSHIDVCGFFFRDFSESAYTPPVELVDFLKTGSQAIYIGFGSIVVDNANELTDTLLNAIKNTKVRALISRGWSKLGSLSALENVIFIDDCPHEWLFPRVAAVVHHGGAGTTACGLLNGRPTAIVPFFGDQPFWGDMIANKGAGPPPIPIKNLTCENLSDAIRFCLSQGTRDAANDIAIKMRNECGVQTAVSSFHRWLPRDRLPCDLLPTLPAVWMYTKSTTALKLSSLAAEILVEYQRIDRKHLKLYKSNPINIENRRWDPVTATSSSLIGTATDMTIALTNIGLRPHQEYMNALELNKSGGNAANPAGAMVLGSIRSIGNIYFNFLKCTIIDLPVAVTEGLRAMPKLYGEKVEDHEPVTGWKSGAKVAVKNFAQGMKDGVLDLGMQPYKAATEGEGGVLNIAAGVGKGLAGMSTKIGAASIGLVAYSGQGISKSIRSATYSKTRKIIIQSRHEQGMYLLHNDLDLNEAAKKVVPAFEKLCQISSMEDH